MQTKKTIKLRYNFEYLSDIDDRFANLESRCKDAFYKASDRDKTLEEQIKKLKERVSLIDVKMISIDGDKVERSFANLRNCDFAISNMTQNLKI